MPAWAKYLIAIGGVLIIAMGAAVWYLAITAPNMELKKLGETVTNIDKNMAVLTNSVDTLLKRDLITRAEVIALIDAAKSDLTNETNKNRTEVARIAELQRTKVGEFDRMAREFEVLKDRINGGRDKK